MTENCCFSIFDIWEDAAEITKLNYIHNNPIKAGLVSRAEDYKYSSASNYMNGDHSVLEVDTEYAGINIS